MVIRPMEIKDIVDVYKIEKSSFSMPWSKEALEEECKNLSAIYYVALINEQVIGYGGMRFVLDEADITNIAVAEEKRKMGIGKKILGQLLEAAKEKGVVTVTLEVRQSNKAAKNLYVSYGFRTIAYRRSYYHQPMEDAEIMQLQIK